MASSDKIKAIVLGHSYVTRLENCMTRNEISNVVVEFRGLPGATICPGPKCLSFLFPQTLEDKPHVVFIQIGENDISRGHSAVRIATEVVDSVQYLSAGGIRVVAGQLLPFPKLVTAEIVATNCELRSRLSTVAHAKFWLHRSGF